MESLDLASEVTTEEVYCWKNNKKKSLDFSKIESQKFIAVIDFGVKNKILSLLENTGYMIVVFPCTFLLKKFSKVNLKGFFSQMVLVIRLQPSKKSRVNYPFLKK